MYDGYLFGNGKADIHLFVCVISSRNSGFGFADIRKKKRKTGNSICSVSVNRVSDGGILRMVKQKGSYTIEAAVWVPLLLMVVFTSLEMGLNFYQEIKNMTYSQKTQSLDIVQEFYNYQVLEEIIQEVEK